MRSEEDEIDREALETIVSLMRKRKAADYLARLKKKSAKAKQSATSKKEPEAVTEKEEVDEILH